VQALDAGHGWVEGGAEWSSTRGWDAYGEAGVKLAPGLSIYGKGYGSDAEWGALGGLRYDW
jgi:hypothetical protein